ncbi:hypothetical protein D3C74_358260 [compost metagenome]
MIRVIFNMPPSFRDIKGFSYSCASPDLWEIMVFSLVVLAEAEATPIVVAIAKDKIEKINILFFINSLPIFLIWST